MNFGGKPYVAGIGPTPSGCRHDAALQRVLTFRAALAAQQGVCSRKARSSFLPAVIGLRRYSVLCLPNFISLVDMLKDDFGLYSIDLATLADYALLGLSQGLVGLQCWNNLAQRTNSTKAKHQKAHLQSWSGKKLFLAVCGKNSNSPDS